MKILYPIGSLYPSQEGGPSNTIYWMAKALTKVGYEVTCISRSTGIDKSYNIEFNKWLNLGYGNVIYIADIIKIVPIKFITKTIIEIRKNDIIHLTSLFYLPSILFAIVAVVMRKKIIWSVRGTLEVSALNISAKKKKVALFLIKLIQKYIIFHSTSPEESHNIKLNFNKLVKITEVPNFIELPQLIKNRSAEDKYFLFLGRLHPIKAIDNLIFALGKSKTFLENKNFKLKIAGEGDHFYVKHLISVIEQNQLQNKVILLGEIRGIEKEILLANSYFLILPSHSENFGNVVVEALAQGTPVISSLGTPWQELDLNNAGFWVDNDVDALSLTIDRALSLNDSEYEKYRKNAYILVTSKYDIDKNILIWCSIYENFDL